MNRKIPPFPIVCRMGSVMFLHAQLGPFSGEVANKFDSGVPKTDVTNTEVNTGPSQKVLIAHDGSFGISSFAPGTYKIEAEVAGFRRNSRRHATGEDMPA